jgi:hypothetical protein
MTAVETIIGEIQKQVMIVIFNEIFCDLGDPSRRQQTINCAEIFRK